MKKKLYITTILLLFTNFLFSQQEVFTLTLNGKKLENSLGNYSIEQVIDARKDKTTIGISRNFLSTKKASINFSEPIEKEFAQFFGAKTSQNLTKQTLILRINDCNIEEYKGKNWIKISISISFIHKANNEFFELFTATDISFHDNGRVLRKPFYETLLANSLELCYSNFSFRSIHSQLKPKKIEEKNLAQYQAPTEFPFQKTKPKKGIYHTYYDFIENTPDTTIDFEVKYIRYMKSKNIIKAKLNSEKYKSTPWGFSNGDASFILINDMYHPIGSLDNEWITFANPDLISLAWTTPTKLIDANQEVPYRFRPDNGIFEYFEKPIPNDTITAVWIFNSAFSDDKNIDVFFNEKMVINLPKATYAIIEMEKIPENLQICTQVKGEEKVCQKVNLEEGKRNYFLAKTKNNKQTTLTAQQKFQDYNKLKGDAKNGLYDLKCTCFFTP